LGLLDKYSIKFSNSDGVCGWRLQPEEDSDNMLAAKLTRKQLPGLEEQNCDEDPAKHEITDDRRFDHRL
jgi:hypothetical protein